MTVTNDMLIKLTDTYKAERERVKQVQRQDLENHLALKKYDLGYAIEKARKERGLTIAEIGAIIGIQNRTFIYDMIGTYRAIGDPGIPVPSETLQEAPVTDDNKPYTIEYNDDADTVTIRFGEDEEYELFRIDGTKASFELPEEWPDHTKERRALYKEILAEIRAHFKG